MSEIQFVSILSVLGVLSLAALAAWLFSGKKPTPVPAAPDPVVTTTATPPIPSPRPPSFDMLPIVTAAILEQHAFEATLREIHEHQAKDRASRFKKDGLITRHENAYSLAERRLAVLQRVERALRAGGYTPPIGLRELVAAEVVS